MKRGKWERGIAVCSFMVCLAGMIVVPTISPKETVSKAEGGGWLRSRN